MRDAIGVQVERAIIHIVDHHKRDKLVLSEAELSLQAEPRLQGYLNAQVTNALSDGAACGAKFDSEGDGAVATLCQGILRDPTRFVSSSQKLAERLLAAMGVDKRIASGSLVVCLYSASNYQGKSFLGLMKIDPSEVFLQRIGTDPKGHRIVRFDIRANAMPTARERLQKAALIKPRQKGADYDLLLLDRQVAKVAADFFAKGFLSATPVLDAQARTESFYIATQSAYNQLTQPPEAGQPRLTPEQADDLLQQIDDALRVQTLDTEAWIDNLDLPDEAKEVIDSQVRRQLPTDRQFSIDSGYAQRELMKKVRFRGDYGVVIEMDADRRDDVIKEKTEIPQQDGKTITRFVLEVPNVRWVRR